MAHIHNAEEFLRTFKVGDMYYSTSSYNGMPTGVNYPRVITGFGKEKVSDRFCDIVFYIDYQKKGEYCGFFFPLWFRLIADVAFWMLHIPILQLLARYILNLLEVCIEDHFHSYHFRSGRDFISGIVNSWNHTFTSQEEAREFIEKQKRDPLVLAEAKQLNDWDMAVERCRDFGDREGLVDVLSQQIKDEVPN